MNLSLENHGTAQQASSCVAFFESQRENLMRLMGSVSTDARAMVSFELSRDEKSEIVALFRAGDSITQISEKLRRSYNSVRTVLIERELIVTKKRPRGRPRNEVESEARA